MTRHTAHALLLAAAALLAACGGGGDDPPPEADVPTKTTQPVPCTTNPKACT